jgi:hypothetical protein
MTLPKLTSPALACLFACALLTGCPKTGVVCNAGLTACDGGCADLSADLANCGACGDTCGADQLCLAGACTTGNCECQTGAISCGSQCVIPLSDPANCGGCASDGGTACGKGQVCEQGQCKAACALSTSTLCNESCVSLDSDPNNCGGCGNHCLGQGCHGGYCSYDVVAACYTTGEVVGLQTACDTLGPLTAFGPAPFALGAMAGALLSADQMEKALVEGRLSDFSLLSEAPQIGSAANQVLVSDPYVYVINTQDNTLQVLKRTGSPLSMDPGTLDAGVTTDGGLGLMTVGEINFGANTSPEWGVLSGTDLFVTLWGGLSADTLDAGQKIVQVDVSNPQSPTVGPTYDLSTLALAPFDGGLSVARPQTIYAQGGLLYAVLNNLDLNFNAAGPGWLAELNPSTQSVSLVSLGASCLDPVDIAGDGAHLFVSCFGSPQYDSNFVLLGNSQAGVVMLDTPSGTAPTVASSWTVTWPSSTDGGCAVPLPGALALVGERLYVGDSNCGRVFSLDVVGNQLVERRGYAAVDGGPPLQVCPLDPTLGFSNVASLLTP